MLTRVFGLHGSGKSAYVYGLLEKCVNEKKQAFLIVPEQQAVSAERMLIEKLGNPANMYVEVINFKRLCNRVFRESGGTAVFTPDSAAYQLAMSHVLSSLSDNLKEYAPLAEDADFSLKMLTAVEQMHRGRITPEMLEDILPEVKARGSESLYNKLCDISLVYRGYSAYTEQTLDFPGDLLDLLYETLCGFDFFEGKTVIFDSFYGFTAQELVIIGKIISTAENTHITFLCNGENHGDKCFERGTSAALSCRHLAEKNGVPVKDILLSENIKHKNSPALEKIAGCFSLSSVSSKDGETVGNGLEIIGCENIYSEAQCAAKTASDLIASGVKPREIAVCAKDIKAYDGIIDSYFEKAGIPFSFDKHTDLSATPVAALIGAAFEIYFSWNIQAMISYIKTGLCGLDDTQADELEIYMRTWNISGKNYFHDIWYMNPKGIVEEDADAEKLERINSSKELILSCIDPFCEALDNAETASDIARAAYTLTADIARVCGKKSIDDGNDGAYLDLLYRVLDCAVKTIGNEQITPKRFYELYMSVIKSMSSGKIPELIDQVRFSPISLMRTDGVKYVIILGVNDGVFPASPDGSDILRDSERVLLKQLGIELSETDGDKAYDEIFLAYTALCSASEKAFVTYRMEDINGSKMYPSIIINILKALCGVTESIFDGKNLLEFAISDEALFDCYLTMPDGVEKATVRAYFMENEQYRARIEAAERGDFSETPLSDKITSQLYKGDMTGSYTRLESFRECPFKHFCKYTLKLTPEPVAQLGSFETGNVVHKLLEELVPVLVERHAAGEKMTDEQVKEEVRTRLSELLKRFMRGGTEMASKRFQYMFARLEGAVNALCIELVHELEVSRFVPADFELRIAPDGDVKPVQADLPDGRKLNIIGAIDRVDLFKDEKTGNTWVRITDYKTGSKKFVLDDIHNGFNLQMLLYLYTLTAQNTDKYGKIYPAGVTYRMVKRPSENASLEQASGADYAESEATSEISGIAVDDLEVIFAMDPSGKGRYAPAKITKDGVSGNALPFSELTALLEEAVGTATELAKGILAGSKKIAPYKDTKHDSCQYCDFAPICGYKE